MRRWTYHHTIVDGEPEHLASLLRSRMPELLSGDDEQAHRDVDGSVWIVLDVDLGWLSTHKSARVTTGVATERGGRLCIPVTWHAEPGRALFPVFEGTIELAPLSPRHAQLTIAGSYIAPMSVVGAAVDTVALRSVADRTVRTVLDSVAAGLRALAADDQPEEDATTRIADERLILQVRDVMTPDPVVLDEEMPIRTAAHLLLDRGFAGAPVVSADGGLVGVLSERDLMEKAATPRHGITRSAAAAERRQRAMTVGDACSRPARVTYPEAPLRAAARDMLDNEVARLVVIDGTEVAGIVTRRDVLRALVRTDLQLQALVQRVLDTLAETGIHATVEWGMVELHGLAKLRSRIPVVIRMVEGVDGVLGVTTDLRWQTDDIVPSALTRM